MAHNFETEFIHIKFTGNIHTQAEYDSYEILTIEIDSIRPFFLEIFLLTHSEEIYVGLDL